VGIDELQQSYCRNVDSNSTAKMAFFLFDEREHLFNGNCKVSSPRKITPDLYHEIPYSIGVHKNCLLYDLLLNVMERTVTAGIPQYFRSYNFEMNWNFKSNRKLAEDNRRILSLNDLEYGYVLWLIACGISTTVFLIELLGSKLKKIKENLSDVFRFLKMINTRFANHQV
jgi:hypothetical protein